MSMKGKVWKFGDNIDTDVIIPARYLVTTDAAQLGKHCMEGASRDFPSRVKKGDIIVAGRNFGCGSSREHAPLAIKGAGISCVVAQSFARIFYRNAINLGLPILECKKASEIKESHHLEINLSGGIIKNTTTGTVYKSAPFPKFMEGIIKAGGLLKWLKKKEHTR